MYLAKYERPTLKKDLALFRAYCFYVEIRRNVPDCGRRHHAAESVSTGEAIRLLNILQQSRNGGIFTSDDKEAIISEILKEYRREMIGDGQVFYAYKRRNVPEIEKGYATSGVITMPLKIYPDIPTTEFDGGRTY